MLIIFSESLRMIFVQNYDILLFAHVIMWKSYGMMSMFINEKVLFNFYLHFENVVFVFEIVNLWGIVKRKMRNKRPKNADELKATVKETWASYHLSSDTN